MGQESSLSPNEERGIFADFVLSIFEPGVNRGVVVVLHSAFVSLILTLIYLVFLTGGKNIHVYVMIILASGVYFGIFW